MENLHPDDEGVVAKIRRLLPEERSSSKRGEKMDWVQLCPFCDVWVGSLVDHVKTAHKDRSSRQIRTLCPFEECGKMVVDIKNHIKMVHYKVRNFSCEECHATFKSNHQTMKHVEAVHTNLKVECVECGGEFKTTTLQSHVRRVHRGIKPAVPCTEPACEKLFGSKADLERHVLGVHMQWKAPCPECGKRIRMETLIKHIKTAHRGLHNIKCQYCGQGFQNQKGLETHVRVKHQGTFLQCRAIVGKGTECGKILYSEEGLISHVECKHLAGEASVQVVCPRCSTGVLPCYLLHHITSVHTDHSTLECVVKDCVAKLSDSAGLRQHVDTVHHTLGLEWCEECGQFVLQLGDHYKLQHEAELPFQPVFGVCEGQECGWEGCKFMASSETHLVRHVRNEHQKVVCIKCEECGKKVKNIEEHVRVEHDKVKNLPCDICEQLFLTKAKLNAHKKKHLQQKEICKQCGAAVMNMRQHERFVHEKDLPFKCDEPGCETKFTSNCGLKKHMESVHQMLREECPICQKLVTNIKNHTKIVHDKVRDHQCPECHKFFQTKTHLQNHVKRVHLGIREQCPECEKMVQDVKSHVNFVHNKVANFPCDQCSTKCLTSHALKMHVSSVHLKEKIDCPECGISVPLAHLGQHVQRKHGDETQVKFSCKECEKLFPSRSRLSKHIMRIHMGLREKCLICGLVTKDLKRHNMHTNCGREGYIPRNTIKYMKEEVDIKNEEEGECRVVTTSDAEVVLPEMVNYQKLTKVLKVEAEEHVEKHLHSVNSFTSDDKDSLAMRVGGNFLVEHSVVINNNMDI